MKKVAVFVVPHEDDFEIFGFHHAHDLIKSGYKIYEIIMTDGRFGTFNKGFSGNRLKRIRKEEVLNAAQTFGVNSEGESNVEIIFMNYCDGYIPVNKRSINKLRDILNELKPQIVIGMDPFFGIDWHHDHIATGRIFYFALKSMMLEDRPKKMYYLQSYKNDIYLPLSPFDLFEKTLNCYRSQMSPFVIHLMTIGLKLFLHLKSIKGSRRPAVGLRCVSFNNDDNKIIRLSDKIKYRLCFSATQTTLKTYNNVYKPLPDFNDEKEDLSEEDFDETIIDNLKTYYFGNKKQK